MREMVRMATERFGHLADDAFVSARQENLETIHRHNVVAERHGLMLDLASEIDDRRACGAARGDARVARGRPGMSAS